MLFRSLPLLGLLLIEGLPDVALYDEVRQGPKTDLEAIIMKWVPQGKVGLSGCATKLIKAGYKENAKL